MRRAQVAVLGLLLLAQPASAAIIHKSFDAILDSGSYAGTTFTGTFSYDDAGATGVGTDYLALASLHFVLRGTAFGWADIDQGGQAILENGVFSYFTAAIFPPTPWPAPVSDIAFGFGGPGVIGYIGPDNQIGLGRYFVTSTPIDELPAWTLMATALIVLGWAMRPTFRAEP